MLKIYIPYNVISSKNSKRIVGKMLINSKAAMEYKKKSKGYYLQHKIKTISHLKTLPKPYFIGFEFVRETKRGFDYTNMAQLPLDILQEVGTLCEDNTDNVVPFFLPNLYDKANCGLNMYFGTFAEIQGLVSQKWNEFFLHTNHKEK